MFVTELVSKFTGWLKLLAPENINVCDGAGVEMHSRNLMLHRNMSVTELVRSSQAG